MLRRPEFQIDTGQFEAPETLDLIRAWFRMETYTGLNRQEVDSISERWRRATTPELKVFLHAQDVLSLAEAGQIQAAIVLATQKLEEVGERFNGDTARAGRFVYYRTRAQVRDNFAENGPLSRRSRGDLTRSYWHLAAAFDYIRADLEYERVSGLAYKASDCFAAAGMARLQRIAFLKAVQGNDKLQLLGIPNFGHPQILALETRIIDRMYQP